MSKPMTPDKCQTLYWNLLEQVGAKDGLANAVFIRELAQTQRCDRFQVNGELKQLRADIEGFLGTDCYQRILSVDGMQQSDDIHAMSAMMHYAHWTRKSIVKSLNMSSWIYYKLHQHGEAAAGVFTLIGISGSIYGGVRIARPYLSQIRPPWRPRSPKPKQPPADESDAPIQ